MCVAVLGPFCDEEKVGEVDMKVEGREKCFEGKEEEEVKDVKDMEVKDIESVRYRCMQ